MSYLSELLEQNKEQLANRLYNDRIIAIENNKNLWKNKKTGKSLPYIGWFWRTTDFVGKQIQIGHCSEGDFIGVMENNKWRYPERAMTQSEVDTFIAYLEKFFDSEFRGGGSKEIDEARQRQNAVLQETWDWFQTLTI